MLSLVSLLEYIKCIFVVDVCDGLKDCVNGDDEFNCELQLSKCPKQCFCLGFAVSCNYSSQDVFSMDKILQNRTYSPFPEKSDQKCPESRFLQSFLLVFSVTIFI